MAREEAIPGDLSDRKKEIVAQLSGESFALFYGAFPSGTVGEVYWNKEIGGDWREFIQVAKKSGVPVLYLDWIDFTKDFFNEETRQLGVAEDEGDPVSDEERDLERETFAPYLGMIGAIRLGFFMNSTFHVYEDKTKWYQDFNALVAPEDSSEKEDEEDDDRERTEGWAEKLANDSGFSGLKKRSDKRSLLRKLVGNDFKKLRVDNVLWRAEALHAENIRAANNEKLAKQAKELRAKNMSILAIAGKLGIPARQVTILLARFED